MLGFAGFIAAVIRPRKQFLKGFSAGYRFMKLAV
jgi:hypothetical protein